MSCLSALIAEYQRKLETNKAARVELQRKIDHDIAAAASLEERARKKREAADKLAKRMSKIPVVGWKAEVLGPLADELARMTGKHPMLSGPAGIGAKVTISLVDDPEVVPFHQDSLEITVEPDFGEDGQLFFNYETGEARDRYKPGTLGAMSGLNNITAPLPDSAEEILGLLRPRPAFMPTKKEGEYDEG